MLKLGIPSAERVYPITPRKLSLRVLRSCLARRYDHQDLYSEHDRLCVHGMYCLGQAVSILIGRLIGAGIIRGLPFGLSIFANRHADYARIQQSAVSVRIR